MIHHLLFADGSLFMCKASPAQIQTPINILKVYGSATGQVVNPSKSSISFGLKKKKKTDSRKVVDYKWGRSWNLSKSPEYFSGSKIYLLNYIMNMLESKLSSWYVKNLS